MIFLWYFMDHKLWSIWQLVMKTFRYHEKFQFFHGIGKQFANLFPRLVNVLLHMKPHWRAVSELKSSPQLPKNVSSILRPHHHVLLGKLHGYNHIRRLPIWNSHLNFFILVTTHHSHMFKKHSIFHQNGKLFKKSNVKWKKLHKF